jgi:hypothetical protein
MLKLSYNIFSKSADAIPFSCPGGLLLLGGFFREKRGRTEIQRGRLKESKKAPSKVQRYNP